jgi:hypothetical protein
MIRNRIRASHVLITVSPEFPAVMSQDRRSDELPQPKLVFLVATGECGCGRRMAALHPSAMDC